MQAGTQGRSLTSKVGGNVHLTGLTDGFSECALMLTVHCKISTLEVKGSSMYWYTYYMIIKYFQSNKIYITDNSDIPSENKICSCSMENK